MKKSIVLSIICIFLLASCGGKSTKKRNLDDTLFKYASLVRWSNYDAATAFLKPGDDSIRPTSFELEKLKQYKVSRYDEAPIRPGLKPNIVLQDVKIQLYNIHTNREKLISDSQTWEYDEEKYQWYLTSGIPKIQ
jgi:hypothetical protein